MKKLLQLSMMALAVASLFMSAGCRTKNPNYDSANVGGWGDGDNPMFGESFVNLPRINQEFTPVYFAFDDYQIPSSEHGKIDAVIRFMQSNNNAVLIVEGHCDERGTIEYNLALGEYRAQSIRSYMINAGMSADRIQTTSFGKERPAVLGSNEAAWAKNRRGEFPLYNRGR